MLCGFFKKSKRGIRQIIRHVILLLFSILSINCESLYSDSTDPIKNFPIPALIKPYYAKGILDTDFGNYGIAQGNVPDDATKSFSNSIISDKNDKIYVAGYIYKFSSQEMVLWRFNQDGSPDINFGSNGYIRSSSITTDDFINYDNSGQGISIDTDGVIYITGYKKTTEHNTMCIWKYDDSVNIKKLEIFAMFDFSEYDPTLDAHTFGNRIKIDNKGRLVVLGGLNIPNEKLYLSIWRYNKNGLLDLSFNNKGFVFCEGSEGGRIPADLSFSTDFAFDDRGRMVVCGSFIYEGNPELNPVMIMDAMSVWRFKEDGTPDETFAKGGLVISDGAAMNNQSGGYDSGNSIVIDSQGRIFIAGTSQSENNYHIAVWCYNDNGELNKKFGNNGILVGDNKSTDLNDLQLGTTIVTDSRNRLLVSGYYTNGLLLRRYDTNGLMDYSFGSNGIILYETQNITPEGVALMFNKKGNILVADEMADIDGKFQMTLWRYK